MSAMNVAETCNTDRPFEILMVLHLELQKFELQKFKVTRIPILKTWN